MANVEGRLAWHDEAAACTWWAIDLMFVFEVGRWKVSHRSRPGTCHVGQQTRVRKRHVGPRAADERRIGVLCLLGTTFRAGIRFCLFRLDVTIFLELGDELLNDFDFEIIKNIYTY